MKHLEGKLWELRLTGRDGIARALYVTAIRRRVVVVRAFVKKTQKTPAVRIIYFVVSRRGVIYMIDIYAKSEKEDLTDAERREIHKLVVALEAEG